MKQLLFFRRFLVSFMFLAVCTLSWAYDFVSDGIYYKINSDGTSVTVTYKTTSYNSYSGAVVIPSTVADIGKTYSVTSIGYRAFQNCSSLKSVTIPNSVTSIGEYAFHYCTSLTSVIIGNSVTSIGEYAFDDCTSLTSVIIGNSVTSIGEYAFDDCTRLTSVTLNANDIVSKTYTTDSNLGTIFGSQVKKYILGDDIKAVGAYAFSNCSGLTSVNIPNGVTSIGNAAFWKCSGLKSVTIGDGVISIGSNAFNSCSALTSVTIGESVRGIGGYAFYGCSALKKVFCWAENVPSTGVGCFNGVPQSSANLYVPPSSVNAYKSADQWKDFGTIQAAIRFADAAVKAICVANWDTNGDGLLLEEEAAQVTDIGTVFQANNAIRSFNELQYFTGLTSIGNYAFSNCSWLSSITIPNSVTSIGNDAFYNCSNLTSITIPNSVTSIGEGAFEYSGLKSLAIPNSVTSIGNYAFSYCSGLTSITIPNSVTSIGYQSFCFCSALREVYCLAENVPYTGNACFNGVPQSSAILYVPASSVNAYKSAGQWKDFGTITTINNIITDVSQLSNDQCYYIHTKGQLRGDLGVNKKSGSLASTFSVTNVKYKTENMSPFVFFKYQDKFLLYSVEANAFVTYNGGLTRMNIIGSNAINVTKNTNEYFMFSFASTGGVVNINTDPGLAINNWGTTSSQFDEGNQFIIEIAGDFDPSVMVALINESETVSDEDEEHYAQIPVQSVSELVNGQVYTAVTNRAAWYVPESGTQLESSKLPIWEKWSCKNTGQQFAFILHDGKYYIYNVGEQKILNGITDNSPNHGELVTDNCQPVTISRTGNLQYPLFFSYGASYNVNINSLGEVVIDTRSTMDDGNKVALRPVQGVTLTDEDLRRIIGYIDGTSPGDINGDGDVNGADIVAVIDYVLNDSKTEGDVNGDGEVNGADIVAVIDYVLSYTGDAVRQQTYYAHRAPARPADTSDRLYANTVADGITVGLTNETDFTAFQFILQLPEDCTLENVIADGLRLDNHVLQFRRMADGRYFVLGYNMDNENIAGHDGALLRLQLAGNICEGASVTDVMFFTPEAETRHLTGIQIDLVTGLTSPEHVTENVIGNIYDMQGRIVMTSGQFAKQKNFLPTGIYIRNGRKFIVK